MNIVYFYSEVMGYTLSVIKELVKTYGAEVHVVYWDHKRKTAYELPHIDHVFYYKRSEMGSEKLIGLLKSLKPELLYVSGRMDPDYLNAAVYARKLKIKTVSGFDNQWHGSLKNRIISFLAPFLYKRYFDYIWVSGVYQYEYARRLGYRKESIIWNVYSADNELFEKISTRTNIAKQFVFVGRLVEVKGLDLLINAFLQTVSKTSHNWKLIIVGSGILKKTIPEHPLIEVFDFLQPEELVSKTRDGGVFVLPSRHEPWGVVLHEFAAAGFPIICSDVCGAGTAFVKDGYNGFIFRKGNQNQLQNKLEKMMGISDEKLMLMSEHSKEISKYINPQISASSLMSILDN